MSAKLRRMNRSSMRCGAAWLEWQKRRLSVVRARSPLRRRASQKAKVKKKIVQQGAEASMTQGHGCARMYT
jgi:hypothetical protein